MWLTCQGQVLPDLPGLPDLLVRAGLRTTHPVPVPAPHPVPVPAPVHPQDGQGVR